ncbi:MAG: GNAT family N-acetyltransferase [Blastococcus sp.]
MSGNVVLRPFGLEDVSTVEDAASDPYVRLITGLQANDSAGAWAYLQRQSLREERGLGVSFAIGEATTGEAVGQIGLWLRAKAPDGATGYREEAHGRAAIGYWVAPSRRRRGYATDALHAIGEWALRLPEVHRLELFIEPWNEGSWRAAEAAGFEREGLLRGWQEIGGERRDMYAYSRLRLTG